MTQTEHIIYKTIAYFSYFGYPVTAFEVWKWQMTQGEPCSLALIMSTLQTSEALKKYISEKHGHYGIGDVGTQLVVRHDRYVASVKKYRKVRRVLSYVARLRSVEGVAICNSLAFHFGRKESDIDLFLLVKDGTLWSTRLLAVLPFLLLGERPGEGAKSPVDMSFFVSSTALDLSSLRLPGEDPYFAFWMQSLVPVFERRPGIFADLLLTNEWAGRALPQSRKAQRAGVRRRAFRLSFPSFVKEPFAERLSRKRLPPHLKDQANVDTRVVMTNEVLKFHSTDRREEIRRHLDQCLTAVS